MTDIDTNTEAVERLLENVTPGPWTCEILTQILTQDNPNGDELPTDIEVSNQEGWHIHGYNLGYSPDVDLEIIANANFIAAARDLVPALLKERDDLRAKLAVAVPGRLLRTPLVEPPRDETDEETNDKG